MYLTVDWVGKSCVNAVITAGRCSWVLGVLDGLKRSSGGFGTGCAPGGSGALDAMSNFVNRA